MSLPKTGVTAENDNAARYLARIERVVRYVHEHFDEPLDVDRLSGIACFSRFHFHRQFTAVTGTPVQTLVRQLRLNQAARQLAFDRGRRITDIALDAGFESPEAFSRAFRKAYGRSPSAFRQAPDWAALRQAAQRLPYPETIDMKVKLVEFPRTDVALLSHRGPEAQVYATVQRFIDWRRHEGIAPDRGETYGLHYHDPANVAPEDYRFDICVSWPGPIAPNPQGVVAGVIPKGRCAVVRHHGSREHIPAAMWLYAEWLPASGEEPRDFPFFFHYVNVGPGVKDRDMVTDLYLPLKDRR